MEFYGAVWRVGTFGIRDGFLPHLERDSGHAVRRVCSYFVPFADESKSGGWRTYLRRQSRLVNSTTCLGAQAS